MTPERDNGPPKEAVAKEIATKRLNGESTARPRPRDERELHPLDSGVVYAVILYRPAYDGMRRDKRKVLVKSVRRAFALAERWAQTNPDARVVVYSYRIVNEVRLREIVPTLGPYSQARPTVLDWSGADDGGATQVSGEGHG